MKMVSFSGIDSSGKSTQISMLMEYYQARGITVKAIWGKARGTPGVMLLKKIVRKDRKMPLDQQLEYRKGIYNSSFKRKVLLIASMIDLIWYFGLYYRLTMLKQEVLLCDRYIWDTYVELRNEFIDFNIEKSMLWRIVEMVSPKPTLAFLFLIPPDVSYSRDVAKGAIYIDTMEMKEQKISDYRKLAAKGIWDKSFDGLRSVADVHMEIVKEVTR